MKSSGTPAPRRKASGMSPGPLSLRREFNDQGAASRNLDLASVPRNEQAFLFLRGPLAFAGDRGAAEGDIVLAVDCWSGEPNHIARSERLRGLQRHFGSVTIILVDHRNPE